MVHLAEEELDEALADFDELSEMYPSHSSVYLFRSMVHDARGDPYEALMDRERATELNPELADLLLDELRADRAPKLTPQLMRAVLRDLLPRSGEGPASAEG
jgi:hypothetical protein